MSGELCLSHGGGRPRPPARLVPWCPRCLARILVELRLGERESDDPVMTDSEIWQGEEDVLP